MELSTVTNQSRRGFLKLLGGLPIAALVGPQSIEVIDRDVTTISPLNPLEPKGMKILQTRISPGSVFRWLAAPGEELLFSDIQFVCEERGSGITMVSVVRPVSWDR